MKLTMMRIVGCFVDGPGDTHTLAKRLGVEANRLAPVLGKMSKRGLIVKTGIPPAWHSIQLDAFEREQRAEETTC